MTAIYSPYGGQVTSTRPEAVQEAPQRPRRDVQPGPGQVLIGRKKVEARYSDNIEKPLEAIEDEERRNIFATVLRIGPARQLAADLTETPWFAEGEEVIIAPNLLTEVDLGGDSVWLIPFSGIRAKFVEPSDESVRQG